MNKYQKIFLFLLRVSTGWLMFYAGITKILNPNWSAAGYLGNAKTFSGFYNWFLQPDMLPYTNFVNEWALTLLGVVLILGVFVRLGSILGAVLMLLYYFPVLQFPYIAPYSYIVDDHIIYALVLLVLASFKAGRYWGLENWCSNLPVCSKFPKLRSWIGIVIAAIISLSAFNANAHANAQMMGKSFGSSIDWDEVVEHTSREEQEGKEVWEKLQSKVLTCNDLDTEQFATLGEYFMGQMMGGSHAAMNAMMIQAHGEQGEEQIHITMSKRLSGCDVSAAYPAQGFGWMPMMQMMWGGWSYSSGPGAWNNMMGFGTYGFFSWIWMFVWWALIIIGLVVVVRWLVKLSK